MDGAHARCDDGPQPPEGARMEASSPARVLVVAHKTAATPALMSAIRARAARGPARFHLLVPNPHHPDLRHAVSRWLHLDLPHRVAHLGLPLTTVIAQERAREGAV